MTREEALQAIKAKMDYYESDKRLRGALETLIPELAESEDEKIRKAIIGIIKNSNIIDINVSEEQMIAYLEKQKEQKPKNILTDDDSLQTAYLKGQTDVLEDPEAYGLQKEQKPAEWSEEDEKWFDYFERLLEFGYNKDPHHLGKLCIGGKMWLKSLRNRGTNCTLLWKPSEKQMKALEDAFRKNGSDEYRKTINSLYQDLKKLM